ncbi:unnamed protein product [Macrosiphum euphorbiae]|uniref:Insulin-like domain-containing protein n=1 Tax=Macrosiphum euphorbiae TaxID=13131 RepID=A0AAV0Y809_9HEMI|nr:unnamed protein product [Macrosiphum euphorbiae]
MAKLIIALLVFCLVGFGRGVVLPQLDPYWDNIDNYCGSRLANELEVICRGKYNELPAGEEQISIGQRRRLRLPLIVDECVTVPCTRRTLKMYCAPDA